jgi:hypothetical protein
VCPGRLAAFKEGISHSTLFSSKALQHLPASCGVSRTSVHDSVIFFIPHYARVVQEKEDADHRK